MHQKRRQRRCEVPPLSLFAIVNAPGVIAADPLAPPMEVNLPPGLVTGQIGISDIPEMGVEAGLGKRLGQAGDAACEAAGARISVRAFEAKHMDLHLFPGAAALLKRVHT